MASSNCNLQGGDCKIGSLQFYPNPQTYENKQKLINIANQKYPDVTFDTGELKYRIIYNCNAYATTLDGCNQSPQDAVYYVDIKGSDNKTYRIRGEMYCFDDPNANCDVDKLVTRL